MNGYDFILAHNIFNGVQANGQKLSGIPTSIFPDDACVISGDVHEPQSLDDGKIIYVGSPYTCDFGDDYQPRALLLDSLNIKSIKLRGLQKRLILCDWGVSDFEDEGIWGYVTEGDIVKIRVTLQTKDVSEWQNIRKFLHEWASKNGVIVNTIQPVVEVVQGERQKLVKGQHKSDNQYFNQYVSRAGVDPKGVEIGRELLND